MKRQYLRFSVNQDQLRKVESTNTFIKIKFVKDKIYIANFLKNPKLSRYARLSKIMICRKQLKPCIRIDSHMQLTIHYRIIRLRT